MSYATLDDLLQLAARPRLVDLTDRATPPAAEIDADVVAQALGDADALIDGYLAGRYALPLTETPPALRRTAAVIAYYNLHIEAAPEKVEKDYARALAWLRDVADGRIKLPVAGAAAPAAAAADVRTSGPDRMFSRDSLRDF